MGEQGFAFSGQGDLAGVAHEEQEAQLSFQLLDLPGKPGLVDREAARGLGEGQLLRDHGEADEAIEIRHDGALNGILRR